MLNFVKRIRNSPYRRYWTTAGVVFCFFIGGYSWTEIANYVPPNRLVDGKTQMIRNAAIVSKAKIKP